MHVNVVPMEVDEKSAIAGVAGSQKAFAVPPATLKILETVKLRAEQRCQTQRGSSYCEDCGELKARTYLDIKDGQSYCYHCWLEFYGEPPKESDGLASKISPNLPDERPCTEIVPVPAAGSLPEDAPRGHPAHGAVRYNGKHKNPLVSFRWKMSGGESVPFQTTVGAAGGSRHAAEVIARACYMKFERGWTKDAVTSFRNKCYSELHISAGKRSPALPFANRDCHDLVAKKASPPVTSHISSDALPRARNGHAMQVLTRAVDETPIKLGPMKRSRSPSSHKVVLGERAPNWVPTKYLRKLLDDPSATLPSQNFLATAASTTEGSQDTRSIRSLAAPACPRMEELIAGSSSTTDISASSSSGSSSNTNRSHNIMASSGKQTIDVVSKAEKALSCSRLRNSSIAATHHLQQKIHHLYQQLQQQQRLLHSDSGKSSIDDNQNRDHTTVVSPSKIAVETIEKTVPEDSLNETEEVEESQHRECSQPTPFLAPVPNVPEHIKDINEVDDSIPCPHQVEDITPPLSQPTPCIVSTVGEEIEELIQPLSQTTPQLSEHSLWHELQEPTPQLTEEKLKQIQTSDELPAPSLPAPIPI
eukprot:TRINITY_DN753_c3_g1_i1.p1 TRINITY_DN753_c3_g1~~TRINITY_DN753_c3_g1_i1.p1  ORF type:complete len:589 (+),score=105.09 TRINITY_DN753_c3_g1_i1:85-1851(+)